MLHQPIHRASEHVRVKVLISRGVEASLRLQVRIIQGLNHSGNVGKVARGGRRAFIGSLLNFFDQHSTVGKSSNPIGALTSIIF